MSALRGARRLGRLLTGPAGRGPAAALAVIAALGAFLATAGPRESAALQDHALRQTLAAAGGVGLSADASWQITGEAPTELLTAAKMQTVQRVIGSFIHPPLIRQPGAEPWNGLSTPLLFVANPAQRAILVTSPQIEVSYRSALAANARLVSGRFPATATTTTRAGNTTVTLQAAVTTANAARFELRPGSRIMLPPSAGSSPTVVVLVTGVIRPDNPGGQYWASEPVLSTPGVQGGSWVGGALIGPGELASLPAAYPLQIMHVSWGFPLDIRGGITVGQAPAVIAAETGVAAGNAGPEAEQVAHAPLINPPQVAPDGVDTIQTFLAAAASAGAIDALSEYGLVAVAMILLLTCALVVADAYEEEVSLVLARGGSTGQTVLRIAGRCAVAAGPGLAAGAAVGLAVTPGGSGTPWLAAAVAVIALAAPALIGAWRHRGSRPLSRAGRADLVIGRRSVRRLVAEATILIAIAGAVVALRLRGAATGSGSDPYVSSAPVLVAVAAGLVAARVYPLPLRGLARLAAPRRSPVGFLGITRAARSRPAALLPALALVVALVVVALGATLRAAVSRGQVAASWQQTGADAVIRTTGSQQVVPPAAERAIAEVPGVSHSAAVYAVVPGDTLAANLLIGSTGSLSTGVLIVDPARYAALVAATPFPAFPAGLLARPGTAGRAGTGAKGGTGRAGAGAERGRAPSGGGREARGRDKQSAGAGQAERGGGTSRVPVVATPGVAADLRKGDTQFAFAGSVLTLRLAAVTTATPGLPGGGPFVIMPSWAEPRLQAGALPNIDLVVGSRLNVTDLKKTLRRTLPASEVALRQPALAAITGSPLVRAADFAFELCVVAAVALTIAAILLGLLLSGRDRTRVAAWLAALGMTGGQARRLAMLDALPLALIAVVGAEIAGLALGPIIAPALDLSAFTGSGTGVPVRPDLVALLAPAAGAVILVILITVGQNALTRRRTRTAVLRLDEGR